MEFPIDIIVGSLSEQGIEIVKGPTHPKERFTWISAFCDEDAERSEEMTVYVVDRDTPSPPEMFRLFVLKPGETLDSLPAPGPGPDDICIRTACSCALIADRIQRYLARIIQWNDQMVSMLEEGCINQDLLKASEPLLHCYIGLSDSTFSYIAHTPNQPPIDELSAYLVKHRCYPSYAIDEARSLGLMRKWEHQDWTVAVDGPNPLIPFPTMNRVIRQHGRYAAHLVLVSAAPLTSAQEFLFDLLAKKVELCLARHWRRENPLEQRYNYFLKDMLLGNISDEDQLAERAEAHGLALTGSFEVCLVPGAWKAGSAEFFAKKLLEAEPDCKAAINEGRVAVLLCAPAGKPEKLADAEEAVFRLAHDLGLEVGVSDMFDHIGWAALALHKARIALRYGRRKSPRYEAFDGPGARTREVFRFRRYFPYFATDPYAKQEKFVAKLLASPHPLERLKLVDRERGTNDLEILRVYLHSEGHVNVVCESLHMHRNTVAYRLEKIRSIVGPIDDADQRMYLRTLYLLMD